MGYGTNGLTFRGLRAANLARLPEFKNAKGEPAHFIPDGSDWGINDWLGAVTGELGEAANLIKKVRRGDISIADAQGNIAEELADVQTYLDLLAYRCGVDLGAATIAKWNMVSERIGCDIYIGPDGDWHRR